MENESVWVGEHREHFFKSLDVSLNTFALLDAILDVIQGVAKLLDS